MSMVITFFQVTPEQLDKAFADPERAEEYLAEHDEELESCYLDKAWDGIRFLLSAAEVWIDLYEDGDPIDEECILLGWDAEMVADAAQKLNATPFEKLAEHYDPEKMNERKTYPHVWGDDDLDYLRSYHEDLVKFFTAAAASGSAAIRDFNF